MLWWIPLLAFASGLIVGLLSVRRFRRDRIAWAKRHLQLKVLSLELKSLRQKVVSADGRGTPPAKRRLVRKLPRLAAWQKWLNTVAKILKAHGFAPRPKGKQPPRESEPGWLTILYNQHVMAIDFKVSYDLAGNRLYIFNLIDHGRRVLHWSRATYQPTAAWVAQQLRGGLHGFGPTLPRQISRNPAPLLGWKAILDFTRMATS